MSDFLIFFWQTVRLEGRQSSNVLTTIALYAMALFVFALILSHEPVDQVGILFPTVSFVLGLVTLAQSSEALFLQDQEDGTLELYVSQNFSLEFYSLAKGLSYWVCIGLPLVILFLLTITMGGGSFSFIFASGISFALTTLTVIFMGMICSALTLASKKGRGLSVVLVLPILVPSILVSHACFSAALSGLEYMGYLAILFGLLLISGGISLCATPFALRLAMR